MKRLLVHFLRALISFGLLGYLIYQADIEKIYRTLKGADYTYSGLALLIFLIALFLFTFRWQLLLQKVNISPGFPRLLVLYFIGYFFNNFLPTTIGGDVSRAYNLAKISGNRAESVGTILLERILGVLATLTLAAFALIWAIPYFNTSRIIIVTVSLMVITILILVNFFNPTLYRFISGILTKIKVLEFGVRVNKVLATIHRYRQSKTTILYVLLLTLVCQFLLILMNYSLAIALGLQQVTIGYLMLVVPVTFVMGLIPSINGLGVRDTGYVLLLARIGVTAAEALSLSFLNVLVPMVMSSIGGIMFIFHRHQMGREPLNEANMNP